MNLYYCMLIKIRDTVPSVLSIVNLKVLAFLTLTIKDQRMCCHDSALSKWLMHPNVSYSYIVHMLYGNGFLPLCHETMSGVKRKMIKFDLIGSKTIIIN